MFIDHDQSQLSMNFELLAQIANEPLCHMILALPQVKTSGTSAQSDQPLLST